MRRNIPNQVKEEYLNWLLTPPGEREPATKKEFVELHGIARSTLQYWENQEDFQAQMRSIKGKWGTRWYGDILGKLMKIGMERDDSVAVSALNTLLKYLDFGDEAKKDSEITAEMADAIKKALEESGYKTIEK